MENGDVKIRFRGQLYMYSDETMTNFIPRTTTIIPYESSLAGKLKILGFDLVEVDGDKVKVILPVHWTHFELADRYEYIVDSQGRKRIRIDPLYNKIELLTRFGYAVTFISNTVIRNIDVATFVTDQDKPIQGIEISKEMLTKMLDESAGDVNTFMDKCIQTCMATLDEHIKDWRNELAYWDK